MSQPAVHRRVLPFIRGARAVALVALAWLLIPEVAEANRLPLPEPDPERGSIAVSLRARFPAGTVSPALQVYFVRLGEDADRFAADSVVPSNLSKNKQVYLLNARAGRYVAVAARVRGQSPGEFKMLLDMPTIDASEIEVRPGEIAFMGDFVVAAKIKLTNADAAQAHYLRLLAPDAAGKKFMRRALGAKYVYPTRLVSLDREPATRAVYWAQARISVFKGEPHWQSKVAAEQAKLREAPSEPGSRR